MKKITLSLVALLAISSTSAIAGGDIEQPQIVTPAVVVVAETPSALTITGNMAITSNALWRGMTQSSNSPALQGAIDLGYNGFYLGTWGSNVNGAGNNSFEADFYAGYSSEIAGIGYDIGVITYTFPNNSDANTEEAYIGLSKDFGGFAINGKYSFGLDDVPDDYEVGASVELPADFSLAVGYGDYDTVGTRYSATLSKTIGKFDISVGYHDFSSDAGSAGDQDNIVATLSTSF